MICLAINWTNAVIITLMGFGIVFAILFLLIFILQGFGVVMSDKPKTAKKAQKQAEVAAPQQQPVATVDAGLPAGTRAAIAMALHLYFADVHDKESHVITIKKVQRSYSPWNSKIYGINNLVR